MSHYKKYIENIVYNGGDFKQDTGTDKPKPYRKARRRNEHKARTD